MLGSHASMATPIQDDRQLSTALGHPESAGEGAEELDDEDLATDLGAELAHQNVSQASVAGTGTQQDEILNITNNQREANPGKDEPLLVG